MARGEAEGYKRGVWVDSLSKEVRGEGICAESVEHVVGGGLSEHARRKGVTGWRQSGAYRAGQLVLQYNDGR